MNPQAPECSGLLTSEPDGSRAQLLDDVRFALSIALVTSSLLGATALLGYMTWDLSWPSQRTPSVVKAMQPGSFLEYVAAGCSTLTFIAGCALVGLAAFALAFVVHAAAKVLRTRLQLARIPLWCRTVGLAGLAGCGGGDPLAGGSIARYDYPSIVDSAFGSGGYLVYSTGLDERVYLGSFTATDWMIDRRGRIVVIGSRMTSDRQAWLFRALPDGRPDPACGMAGWLAFSTGGPASPQRVKELPDGRYVVAGNLGVASVWAITEDCRIDTKFGASGKAVMPAQSPIEIQGGALTLEVDSLGRIVALASATLSGRLHAARWLADGTPDRSFGPHSAGYVSVAVPDGAPLVPGALAIRPDNRVLVAVTMAYNTQTGYWPGFVQLAADGMLDPSFGDGGVVAVKPVPNYYASPKDLVLLEDGSAIQAGSTQPGVLVGSILSTDAYWLKVTPNGKPATGFGSSGNGMVTWTAGPTGRSASSNYVTRLLSVGAKGQLMSCMNWLNNTKQGNQVESAYPQAIVQLRSSLSGELLGNGASSSGQVSGPTGQAALDLVGTGWLPRSTDQNLSAGCLGLATSPGGGTLALLDYGPAERAVGEAFAIARIR